MDMNKTNWLVEIETCKAVFVNCDQAATEAEAIEFCKRKFGIPPDEVVISKVTPMASSPE